MPKRERQEMNCTTCNTPYPQCELADGLCLKCCASELTRLRLVSGILEKQVEKAESACAEMNEAINRVERCEQGRPDPGDKSPFVGGANWLVFLKRTANASNSGQGWLSPEKATALQSNCDNKDLEMAALNEEISDLRERVHFISEQRDEAMQQVKLLVEALEEYAKHSPGFTFIAREALAVVTQSK
jgi:hypothetical protein